MSDKMTIFPYVRPKDPPNISACMAACRRCSVAGDAAPAPPANPPEEGDLNDFGYQKSENAMVKYENTR